MMANNSKIWVKSLWFVSKLLRTWFSNAVKGLKGNGRFFQVVGRVLVRRFEFRWYHFMLLLYIGLLWRSTRKTGAEYWKKIYAKTSTWRTFVTAHVVLWRYILTKASLGALMIQNVALAPVDFVGKQSAALQDRLQARVEEFLDRQMDFLAEKLKQLLKDPYMPFSIQGTVDDFVDVLLPDLKLQLFIKTNEYISSYRARRSPPREHDKRHVRRRKKSLARQQYELEQQQSAAENEIDSVLEALEADEDSDYESDYVSNSDSDVDSEYTDEHPINFRGFSIKFKNHDMEQRSKQMLPTLPSWQRIREMWLTTRAWVLYSLSPFDRSIWRQIRNPFYLLLQGIGLIPGFGMVWWLYLFILHDKRDEFQLSQFIVGFQTAKFFSQGCFNLLRGAFLYYLCTNREVPRCDTHGPKVRDYMDALFFFVQIILVWLTFFILPHSEPCYNVNDPKDAYLLDEERNDRSQAALRAKVRLGRGGRLMKLFWWDTVAVCLVTSLGAFAYFVLEQRGWQLRATCYWLATLYGLTGLPFIFFKIPVMGALLTPTRATGYTRDGFTVIRVVAPPPQVLLNAQARAAQRRTLVRRPSALFVPEKDKLGQVRINGHQPKELIIPPHEDEEEALDAFRKSFFLSDKYEQDMYEMEEIQSPQEPQDSVAIPPPPSRAGLALSPHLSSGSNENGVSMHAITSAVANETTDSSSMASAQFLKDWQRFRRSSSKFQLS